MCNKIIVKTEDDHIEYTNDENLFYQRKEGVVCLYDDTIRGELGWFEIWEDSDMDKREYIIVNHTIIYLDSIDEL